MSANLVKSTELVSLSAKYRYDNSEYRPKIDFKPNRFDYIDEGYSFFKHPMYDGTKDEIFSNHSFFGLTNQISMEDMKCGLVTVDPAQLVIYTTLRAPNGKYLKVVDGKIYAITEPTDEFTRENIFKIYKTDDLGFLVSNGNLFATVTLTMNRFTIAFEDYVHPSLDDVNAQHFGIYRGGSPDTILINTLLNKPWGKFFSVYDPTHTQKVKRFWSIYDHASSPYALAKPKSVYDGTEDYIVKANGILYNPTFSGIPTIDIASNNYIFKVDSEDYNISETKILLGYNGQIKWVNYHNDFYDNFFNSNVTIRDTLSGLTPNFMVEYPYNAGITDSTKTHVMKNAAMEVNPITLKNAMTPDYRYTVLSATNEDSI